MRSSSCKSHCGVREQYKGSLVHPLHISNSYCRRPEEQDQLVCVFFSLLLLLRRSAGCEALLTSEASARHRPRQQHEHLSAARSPSNSRPIVGRLFCTSTLAFLFFVVFFNIIFVPCCRFTILLRSGSDTQLVNEHRRNRLNKEVGRLPCVETAEQWPPLCELSFFFFFFFLVLNTM